MFAALFHLVFHALHLVFHFLNLLFHLGFHLCQLLVGLALAPSLQGLAALIALQLAEHGCSATLGRSGAGNAR